MKQPSPLTLLVLLAALMSALPAQAQPEAAATTQDPQPKTAASQDDQAGKFNDAVARQEARLAQALKKLDEQRAAHDREIVKPTDELAKLRADLEAARERLQKRKKDREEQVIELTKLVADNGKTEKSVKAFINQFTTYFQELRKRVHIVEEKQWLPSIDETLEALAAENRDDLAVLPAQQALLERSIARLENQIGGARLEVEVVDPNRGSQVKNGDILLFGPAAIFRSKDGDSVGLADRIIGKSEPMVVALADEQLAARARDLIDSGSGTVPIDPSGGDARKLEETKTSHFSLEHIQKGGTVIWPILGLGALALLIALVKWGLLAAIPSVSRAQFRGVIEKLGNRDFEGARDLARRLKGPTGRMLQDGVDNLERPRELAEEVMYESILSARLRVNRALPFIAVTAASAPLLGLLGTVTGIITTFDQINAFGSSDVKSISGGISEALITTEFGLIVAIPSLLLHAFLSRKARGIVGKMESTALAFVNEANKVEAFSASGAEGGSDVDTVRHHVNKILSELLASTPETATVATAATAANTPASPPSPSTGDGGDSPRA